MEKPRQCLEPRPVDIARVAVSLTVVVGGVLHTTGFAVASGIVVALLDFPVFTAGGLICKS